MTKSSWSSFFVAFRYHQVNHWCWQYPNITCLNVSSGFYDVDPSGQVRYDSNGYGWYYTWAGGPFGGHYAHRDGKIDNCILRYGCIGSYYPYVDMWIERERRVDGLRRNVRRPRLGWLRLGWPVWWSWPLSVKFYVFFWILFLLILAGAIRDAID